MTSPDQSRRARRVWALAVALVVVAVGIPVAVLAVRDTPASATRDHLARTAATPTSSTPAHPAAPVPSQPAAPQPEVERGPTRALFFGDSYFIGGGYTGEHDSMAKLAGNRLGWESEVNGGGGTGFVATNYEYGLGNYLEQIAQGAFDVGARRWVVIQGGNNDRSQPLDEVRANARRVVRIAQRTFPRAKVVLVGPLDTDEDHSDLVAIIKAMRKVANKRDVPFVNMKNWLAGHYDLIGPDFIHPYPEGHRLLARKLAKALRQLGA